MSAKKHAFPRAKQKQKGPVVNTQPAADRLYQKVAALGDDAPLELDEIAAFWSVSMSSAAKLVADLPVADPFPRIRRWRYGDVRRHFAEMVKAS